MTASASESASTWDLLKQARLAFDQAERVSAELDRINSGELNPMAPLAEANAKTVDKIVSDYMTFDDILDDYALNVAILVGSKQRDYGPRAINGAPGGALNGINVRLHDKLARVVNLGENLHPSVDEAIFDTYMDIAGYALIAMLYLDGKWPA